MPLEISSETLKEELNAYFEACVEIEEFSGVALLLKNREILLKKAAGMACYEHDIPNTTRTRFRLGSITKPISAAAILMLAEEGKLKSDDHLTKYFTDCPAHWREIKIEHLLRHQSGLPNFTEFPDYSQTQGLSSTVWQTIERFKHLPLESKPGERTRYNNSGYILLGALIEHLSGLSYKDFITSRIFEPLKMYESGYDCHKLVLKDRARGYIRSKHGLENAPFLDMSIPFAAGALYSNLEDMHIFEEAISRADSIFPQELLKVMSEPHNEAYGAGWHIDNKDARYKVGHSGGIDGFCTIMLRFPFEKLSIIVLSNVVSYAYSPERIAHDLAAIVFQEPCQFPRAHRFIELEEASSASYQGTYFLDFAEGGLVFVWREGSRWFLRFNDAEQLEIFPTSETEFFALDLDAQIKFVINEEQKASHLILIQEGQRTTANKCN